MSRESCSCHASTDCLKQKREKVDEEEGGDVDFWLEERRWMRWEEGEHESEGGVDSGCSVCGCCEP